MSPEQRTSNAIRIKSAFCLASGIAVGVAVANYVTPVQVSASAATCCDNSWDCGFFERCDIDTEWVCQPRFFGKCVS